KPVATAWRAPGRSVTFSAATTSIPAACSVARAGSGSPSPWGSRISRISISAGIACSLADRLRYPLGQPPRDLGLAQPGPMFAAAGCDEMHLVAVAAHHVAGDVVGDDPVGALAFALCRRLRRRIPGLRREADDQPR